MDNLVTLTINSTHFFLIGCKGGWLLVDAGWSMAQFASQMKAHKLSFQEIKYVMFTHHHPDHAGLVQNIRQLSGAKLIIHEKQIPFLEPLQAFFEKKGGYEPIQVEKDDWISPDRSFFPSIGLRGEILETPGHSEDSISLVLDGRAAFIGDLHPPEYAGAENLEATLESWKKLLACNVPWFYPSHAAPFPAAQIDQTWLEEI